MTPDITYQWDGKVMRPLPRFVDLCERTFEIGERCILERKEYRSHASMGHYFAALKEGWTNLAEEYGEEFPTVAHLRAWCLVKAGYADKQVITCATPEDAARTAAIASSREKIRIVNLEGCVLTIWVPHSQSMKAMGKKEFQDSKQKVLDIVAAMARTTRTELEANAGKAA